MVQKLTARQQLAATFLGSELRVGGERGRSVNREFVKAKSHYSLARLSRRRQSDDIRMRDHLLSEPLPMFPKSVASIRLLTRRDDLQRAL